MIDQETLSALRMRVNALELQVDQERNRLAEGDIDDVAEYQRVHDAFQRAFAELVDAETSGVVPDRFR